MSGTFYSRGTGTIRNMTTDEQAKEWVRKHKKELIERFAGDEVCPSTEQQLTIFMAGSPGAGKTETSKSLIQDVYKPYNIPVVRIDPDEMRSAIPHYKGDNTDEVKGASFLAVEKLYDYVLAQGKNAILDSTFSKYEKQEKNIARALAKGRMVQIVYVYQDPLPIQPIAQLTIQPAMTTSDFINLPVRTRRSLYLKAARSANAMQRELVREVDCMTHSPRRAKKGDKRKSR